MSEKKLPAIPEDRQSQLKLLIARGKEQGYLTYAEVNDHLPPEIVDPEQIEDIVNTINDMGITVYEKAPDAESLVLSDSAVSNDEDAAEEAAAGLAGEQQRFGVGRNFVHLDAHAVDHADDVFDLFGIDDVVGQVIVDFGVGQVTLFQALADQLLDIGLGGLAFVGHVVRHRR